MKEGLEPREWWWDNNECQREKTRKRRCWKLRRQLGLVSWESVAERSPESEAEVEAREEGGERPRGRDESSW